jgi:hypothetical protein
MKSWAARLGRLWVPVIWGAFFLGPAGAGAASPQGVLKQAIHWRLSADWLDTSTASYGNTANHPLYFFHDALLKAMPDGSYSPCLAESWSISPDFKVYEFKLREGVKFHNGDTLTAEDVVFSYNSNHANVKYVSNYQDLVSSYVVFPREGEPSLHISNRLYLPYAKLMSILPRMDAVDYDPGGAVERRLRELGPEKGTIGLVGLRGILYGSLPFGPLAHWHKAFPGSSFVDATDILADVRLIKSREEIAWFRMGAALTDLAFEALEKKARAGMTDFQLAGVIAHGYMPRGGGVKGMISENAYSRNPLETIYLF